MPKYIVWRPDHGESKAEGKIISEPSPDLAAEAFARWSDWSSADYSIAGGHPEKVCVAEEHDNSPAQTFEVNGGSDIWYRARAIDAAARKA
jgi:hypothetical protein